MGRLLWTQINMQHKKKQQMNVHQNYKKCNHYMISFTIHDKISEIYVIIIAKKDTGTSNEVAKR